MSTRHINHLNVPFYAVTSQALACYRDGTCTGYVADKYRGTFSDWSHNMTEVKPGIYHVPGTGYYFDSMFVSEDVWGRGFDADYFRQNLVEAYAEPFGNVNCLPCSIDSISLVEQSGYFPIDTNGSATVGDLMKRLHYYFFDGAQFVLVDENAAENNLTRYVKQYEIFKVLGNDGGRIADYAKVIAFMLQTILPQMTAEQQAAIQPFLDNVPDIDKLQLLAGREAKVNEILNGVS